MSGNRDNTRAEEFKRATAGVLRAIAEIPDVQVNFQPGASGVSGKRARLPLPTRALPPAEIAKLRGASDAIALRLRHHNDALHTARMPARREARDAFDALEQARVEAVGARRMAGVAANLRAKLIEQCESEGYDRMTRREQLPVAAALSLLAREQMCGEAAPPPALRVLDLWRDTLGTDAEAALTELARTQNDQRAFSRAARKLLAALDLAEAEAEAEPDDESEQGEQGASNRTSRTTLRTGRASRNPSRRACWAPSPRRWKATRQMTKAPRPRTRRRLPRATTGPAARSPAGIGRTSRTRPPTAPMCASSTRK